MFKNMARPRRYISDVPKVEGGAPRQQTHTPVGIPGALKFWENRGKNLCGSNGDYRQQEAKPAACATIRTGSKGGIATTAPLQDPAGTHG
jgi:hypothetical protein